MPSEALKRSRSPELDAEKSNKRPNTSSRSLSTSTKHLDGDTSVVEDPNTTMSSEDGNSNGAAPVAASSSSQAQAQSSAEANGTTTAGPVSASPSSTSAAPPGVAAQNIHMRCLIVTTDASVIIGRSGAHVNEIREKSGARIMVSESIPGNPERILNVSGALDAVSKAFGLIVRRINDEPYDVPSIPGSRAVTIKFIIPNSRMGSVIGKGGSKIKEIQEASGAKLNASEGMLPGSTERVLSVSGVADAIHIATYYVGNILIEAGALAPSATQTYRPSAAGARPPRSSTSSSHHDRGNSYSSNSQDRRGGGGGMPSSTSYGSNTSGLAMMGSGAGAPGASIPNDPSMPQQTQQIYIPNDLVGCIIGKGGSKINEIRTQSQSQIKIMEQGSVPPGGASSGNAQGGGERLVTITGGQRNVAMAVQLLYQRLETERQRVQSKSAPA